MPSASKRPADDQHTTPTANKAPRPDHHGDFDGSLKRKIAGSTRTGQACDRCKIRKIRCDARSGGCSPCAQNNTECKTTDRITGRASFRGHTENLENENSALKQYIAELQVRLKENGIDAPPPPMPGPGYGWSPATGIPGVAWPQTAQAGPWDMEQTGQRYGASGSQHLRSLHSERNSSQCDLLPTFRSGCIGDNYLGVSSANDLLSPIKGTSLALFGMELDLVEFLPSELDGATSPMSYETFLAYAFNKAPQQFPPVMLPPYDQCKIYAEWYLRSINPFAPILHKPDFMELLRKFNEDPTFQSTAAETVMVHMVLAHIQFQYSVRNHDERAQSESTSHYHYALTFVHDLMTGHTLQDMQALALICGHLRNFPRPGAAWMFTNMVLGLAIELGLHRSVKAWQGAPEKNSHEAEMRKRIFWSLMLIHVSLSGKLGRPMPMHLEDFDVETPELVFDNLPSESGLSDWRKCSFRAAVQAHKLLVIIIQVYSTIYTIRSSSQPYEITVRTLERQLQTWQEQCPLELAGGNHTHQEDRVFALYLQLAVHECRLQLHHPALCRTSSPQVVANNMDMCLDASSKVLSVASQLRYLKSLDTTWYYSTIFLAAIFTTLFAYTERKDSITSIELNKLRKDMNEWVDIMGDVGNLLGTGARLQTAVDYIIDYWVGGISAYLAAKTASAAVASSDISQPSGGVAGQQHPQTYSGNSGYGGGYSTSQNSHNNVEAASGATQAYAMTDQQQPQNPYPSRNQFAYPEPTAAAMPSYAQANISFEQPSYQGQDVKPELSAQLVAHNASMAAHVQQTPQHPSQSLPLQHQQPPAFLAAFQSPHNTASGFQVPAPTAPMNDVAAAAAGFPNSGPAAWRHFADSMMSNMGPQDYMTSANALMALGASKSGSVDLSATSAMAGVGVNTVDVSSDTGQPWPLMTYNTGQQGGKQ